MGRKGRYKLNGGIGILGKGEFRVGIDISRRFLNYEPYALDLYLFKLHAYIVLEER